MTSQYRDSAREFHGCFAAIHAPGLGVSAVLEMRPRGAAWSGGLLREVRLAAASRKPVRRAEAFWRAEAMG
ncbi:MAG: hypothetical protein Q8N47_15985 [Bryobacterales bacterium]|nr:hypothetical protein [Bryobacterales bacterium]